MFSLTTFIVTGDDSTIESFDAVLHSTVSLELLSERRRVDPTCTSFHTVTPHRVALRVAGGTRAFWYSSTLVLSTGGRNRNYFCMSVNLKSSASSTSTWDRKYSLFQLTTDFWSDIIRDEGTNTSTTVRLWCLTTRHNAATPEYTRVSNYNTTTC